MSINANTSIVLSQQRGGKAVLKFQGTSANVVCASNSTVQADIAVGNNSIDPIRGAAITGMWWSLCGNSTVTAATVTVARQANTVYTLQGGDQWTQSNGFRADRQDFSANLVVTFNAPAQGTLIIELSKVYEGGNPPDLDGH